MRKHDQEVIRETIVYFHGAGYFDREIAGFYEQITGVPICRETIGRYRKSMGLGDNKKDNPRYKNTCARKLKKQGVKLIDRRRNALCKKWDEMGWPEAGSNAGVTVLNILYNSRYGLSIRCISERSGYALRADSTSSTLAEATRQLEKCGVLIKSNKRMTIKTVLGSGKGASRSAYTYRLSPDVRKRHDAFRKERDKQHNEVAQDST